MSEQETETEQFFDRIAPDWRAKYSGRDAYCDHFFSERMKQAIRGLQLNERNILDIGAGTGNLYDYLAPRYTTMNYFAVDVSANMLAQSNIPLQRQFVGKCHEVGLPQAQFDYIFMLGVSTYMETEELRRSLDFFHDVLSEDGIGIVTFTNRASIDHWLRTLLKHPLKIFGFRRYIIGQAFAIHAYTVGEARSLLEERFRIEDCRFLNHTVFPFNRVLTRPSIWIADRLKAYLKGRWLRVLSSDFIFLFSKK